MDEEGFLASGSETMPLEKPPKPMKMWSLSDLGYAIALDIRPYTWCEGGHR